MFNKTNPVQIGLVFLCPHINDYLKLVLDIKHGTTAKPWNWGLTAAVGLNIFRVCIKNISNAKVVTKSVIVMTIKQINVIFFMQPLWRTAYKVSVIHAGVTA